MDERGLYAGPFVDFVARRRGLAQELRDAGDASSAKTVLARRKPTRSAWLVNVLTNASPELVEDFLALGPELAQAHRDADGAQVRELSRARGHLVDRLVTEAVAAGEARGYTATPAVRDEVAETLTAALADPDLAERVRAGVLVQPERAAGFGPAGPMEPLAPVIPLRPERVERPRPDAVADDGPDRAARLAALAERLSGAEAAAAGAEATATAARERAERAAAELRDVRGNADDAGREVADLRARLEAVERTLADVLARARTAEGEADRCRRMAADADAARARAIAELDEARAETARELGLSSGPSS